MAFEHYLRSGNKMMRCGYTTGTCAALAASGAAAFLLLGEEPEELSIMTGKGLKVKVPVFAWGQEAGESAWCSVLKDAGDDADVTDGMEVKVTVSISSLPGIRIDGGEGVGRVTKPGLDQPVGNAAINSVPRQMIAEEVRKVCEEAEYTEGLEVVVSIPEGQRIAEQTFNAMLGVEGGLSILGTTGIVEPMSEKALVDTIEVKIRQVAAESKALILTPGNYGERFIAEKAMDQMGIPVVKCSNFIGEALDMVAMEQFEEVLLLGHMGKLVKVAAGIMNTHSRYADGRNEIFCAHTALCISEADGGGRKAALAENGSLFKKIMEAATTDACIALLEEAGLRQQVMESILKAAQKRLDYRAKGAFRVGAVMFSNQYGILGYTEKAKEILDRWKGQK